MKYLACILTFLLSASAHSGEHSELSNLESLEWKNRIVVVNELNNQAQTLATFEQNTFELDDRKIIWFIIQDNTLKSNYSGRLSANLLHNIFKNYSIGSGKVALIGYDGELKQLYDSVDVNGIFSAIDSMPMRIQEMRFES